MVGRRHWDHVFGASAIDAVAIATATAETREQISTMPTHAWTDTALDERVASAAWRSRSSV